MPTTRAQRKIDFPAKKSNTRSKKVTVTDEDKIKNERKRPAKGSNKDQTPCSPPKLGRKNREEKLGEISNSRSQNVQQSTMSPRKNCIPLSPRMELNILNSKVPLSPCFNLNKCNILKKSPQSSMVMMKPSPMKAKACLFAENDKMSSPVKINNMIFTSPNQNVIINNRITPIKNGLISFKENMSITPENMCSATKVKALRFDSPRKQTNSPRKEDYPNPRILDMPIRQSPRKLDCLSPRKFEMNSPRKLDMIRQSPRKLNSPLKFDAVRQSPRKLASPFRLAKQEGLCYQRAKQALHTALPERLVCREKEYKQVNDFLGGCLDKKKPGSLYISGAPGTGKTAVLSHTLKAVESEKKAQMIYINCMSVKNSQAIFNKILGEIKGKETSFSTKEATKQLEKCLTSKGQMICMVMDECDQLDSKNQEVLYTMFEWPHLTNSRLVLVGIANALDLTDRILPRLQAKPKCKPKIMNFAPYTKDQIVTIIKDRLSQVEVNGQQVLDPSAVVFCARKVSAVAGDMRKALDVCRRAVEMVENEVKKQQIINLALSPSKRPQVPKKIGVAQIMKVVNEVYGTRVSVSSGQNNTIPLQQKLAICSLLLTLQNGKAKEIPLGKLHENYCKVCKNQEVPSVDQSEFLSVCTLIEARGIMGVKRGKETRLTKISLKLDERELEQTLQDKVLMSSILKNGLPC